MFSNFQEKKPPRILLLNTDKKELRFNYNIATNTGMMSMALGCFPMKPRLKGVTSFPIFI